MAADHPDIEAPLRAALTLRFHEHTDVSFLEQPFTFEAAHPELIGERVGAYTIESLLGKDLPTPISLASSTPG